MRDIARRDDERIGIRIVVEPGYPHRIDRAHDRLGAQEKHQDRCRPVTQPKHWRGFSMVEDGVVKMHLLAQYTQGYRHTPT